MTWDRFKWLKALQDSDASRRMQAVGAVLFRFADEHGAAWPTIPTIAEKASCAPNTVRSAIRDLKAAGWLTTAEHRHPNGVGYRFNLCTPSTAEPVQSLNPFNGCVEPLQPLHPNRPKNKPDIHTPRVRDESTEQVMLRVESETKRVLTDEQAVRLLALAGGSVSLAVECFVDTWSGYKRAKVYDLIQWAGDRITKRQADEAKPRAGPPLSFALNDRRDPAYADDDAYAAGGSHVIRED